MYLHLDAKFGGEQFQHYKHHFGLVNCWRISCSFHQDYMPTAWRRKRKWTSSSSFASESVSDDDDDDDELELDGLLG